MPRDITLREMFDRREEISLAAQKLDFSSRLSTIIRRFGEFSLIVDYDENTFPMKDLLLNQAELKTWLTYRFKCLIHILTVKSFKKSALARIASLDDEQALMEIYGNRPLESVRFHYDDIGDLRVIKHVIPRLEEKILGKLTTSSEGLFANGKEADDKKRKLAEIDQVVESLSDPKKLKMVLSLLPDEVLEQIKEIVQQYEPETTALKFNTNSI